MTLDVRIGGLTFSGGDGGEGFFIREWSGWWGGVDPKTDAVARPQADGDFDVPGFLEPRILTLTGRCHAKSAEYLEQYELRLSGLFGSGKSQRVMVDGPGGTQWADGRRAGSEFEIELWGAYAAYQLVVKFANPRKFGESRSFTGTAPVAHHYGNFPATPVLTVTGASSGGYTISGPEGRSYVVTRALTSGTPHVIDMATGRLLIAGVVQVGAVSVAQTWAIPPGTKTSMSITGGSAVLSVSVLDTYI